VMIDGGFRINEASVLQWSDIDFDNGVIYLYRSKVSNDDFIPMTNRLRTALANRKRVVDSEYVFPGRFGGHKTIQNNRALEAAFQRAGLDDVSSHNLRKTFATRLLNRGAAITDVQHLLGHSSVKTTERAFAAFVKNEVKVTEGLLFNQFSMSCAACPLPPDRGRYHTYPRSAAGTCHRQPDGNIHSHSQSGEYPAPRADI